MAGMAPDDAAELLATPDGVSVRPLEGLSASQRLKAAAEMADQITLILEAVERGEIDASAVDAARLQGAVVALRTITG